MKKALSLVLIGCSLSTLSYAKEFMQFGVDNYEPKKSVWEFDVGMNYIQYPTYLPKFEGEFYKNRDVENIDVYGPQIGIGRDIHITGGFSVKANLGLFYYWTFNNETGQAAEDIDVELASNRRTHAMYGGNASMSLNYIFEGKIIDIQPFIMGGVGVGRAQIEREYKFLGIGTTDEAQENDRELFDIKVEDTFSYREIGLGVNFISKRGIVTYLKGSKTTLALNEREYKGSIKTEGGTQTDVSKKEKNGGEYEVYSAAVGIGFLF